MTISSVPTFPPNRGRTHEVCGQGAFVFAFALAGCIGGRLIWVRERWKHDKINPNGFAEFMDPDNVLLCNAKDHKEVLGVSEEALRSGAASLVVMELNKSVSLTEGRRLQLAAKDGDATGLAIISEEMGSNAADTRWHCAPVFNPDDSTSQRWKLIKNKTGTIGAWNVQWDTETCRFVMVSPTGQ